jgi:hypothetical protein
VTTGWSWMSALECRSARNRLYAKLAHSAKHSVRLAKHPINCLHLDASAHRTSRGPRGLQQIMTVIDCILATAGQGLGKHLLDLLCCNSWEHLSAQGCWVHLMQWFASRTSGGCSLLTSASVESRCSGGQQTCSCRYTAAVNEQSTRTARRLHQVAYPPSLCIFFQFLRVRTVDGATRDHCVQRVPVAVESHTSSPACCLALPASNGDTRRPESAASVPCS